MVTYEQTEADFEGLTVLTAPTTLVGNQAPFQKMYMRPNLANGNLVPATGAISSNPDIWPNATQPVPNFQTALAANTGPYSYPTQSPVDITLLTDNYIYVRACNGAASAQTNTVTLYYAPSGVVQHPSYWSSNVIQTDQGNSSANITNLAPGAVGVADQTFLWHNVQPPPSGSDHYCLIAQLNDAANSNPIPDPSSPLDLSDLVLNNLGWGWHNIALVSAPAGFAFSYNTGLTIPANFPNQQYTIMVNPIGYQGWSISYQCSQTDSNGNPVVLSKTLITGQNVQYGGAVVTLNAGYNALLTISMYNDNNVTPASGAHVTVSANYVSTSHAEFEEAHARGLIDWRKTYLMRDLNPEGIMPDGIPIFGVSQLGTVTGRNPNVN
jgi:hypothetical protein